jgi:carbon-monoxide dehydrogenase small subunit
MRTIALTINDKAVTAAVEPRLHLADFLREDRNLTGTHIGCEHGVCGACTVLLDGAPARSCITFAVACDGGRITTIEGLDNDEVMNELRVAFAREHALQCGYCTPGMLISARDVVLRLDRPSEIDLRTAMSGNLCRCTGYVGIIRAVESVIAERRGKGIAAVGNAGRTALGPVGSGHASATSPSAIPQRSAARAAGDETQSSARAVDFKPQATFSQSFVVAHPREQVWAFFADVPAVAACLPGAFVTGTPSDDQVNGKMRVKIGPMAADFHGTAQIHRDDATWSGTILGSGRDARSNSSTRGSVGYRLSPGETPQSTRVDVTVAYAVTGAFAQFSRGGLIQDVANRLTQTFAANLEARLAGGAPPPQTAELNAASLVYGAFIARVKAWLRRVLSR